MVLLHLHSCLLVNFYTISHYKKDKLFLVHSNTHLQDQMALTRAYFFTGVFFNIVLENKTEPLIAPNFD